MAKATEIGSSSIKKCLLLGIYTPFPNHFKNYVYGKVSRRQIRTYIVLYTWDEYCIDILAHKCQFRLTIKLK